MTCPQCGTLAGAADRCPQCGVELDEEITIVLHPAPAGAAPVSDVGEVVPLPPLAPPTERLVIELEEEPIEEASTLAPPSGAPVPLPPPAAAPAVVPGPAAPWQPAAAVTPPAAGVVPPPAAPLVPVAGPPAPPSPPAPPLLGPGAPPPPQRKRQLLLAGGAAALLLTAGLLGWLLLRSDADQRLAGSALQAGQSRVTRLAERATIVTRLQAMRKLGEDALEARQELSGQDAALAQLGDATLREEVIAVTRAQRRYLEALGAMRGLTQSAVRRPQPPVLEGIQRDTATALRALTTAQDALKDADLPGETEVDPQVARAATQRVVQKALEAGERLRAFDRRKSAYDRSVRAAQARAQVVVRYRASVLAILSGYEQDRSEVDRAAARIDAMDPEDAAQRFDDFKAQREQVISALEQSVPSAPAVAAAAPGHRALGEPVAASLQGLDAALTAISDAYFDDEPVTVQPAWPSFQDTSDQITRQLATAKSQWLSTVARLEQEARQRGVLPRPKAPDV